MEEDENDKVAAFTALCVVQAVKEVLNEKEGGKDLSNPKDLRQEEADSAQPC